MYHMLYIVKHIYLCMYVDDIIIAYSELAFICENRRKLRDRYDMSDMGALEHFLNVHVPRTSSYIQLNQSMYSQKILDTFSAYLGAGTKTSIDRIAKEA